MFMATASPGADSDFSVLLKFTESFAMNIFPLLLNHEWTLPGVPQCWLQVSTDNTTDAAHKSMGSRVMIPLRIPLGKTPVLQPRLAFKQAGRVPDPVLTPDCANVVVCVRIPGKLVLGDGHKHSLSQGPPSLSCLCVEGSAEGRASPQKDG